MRRVIRVHLVPESTFIVESYDGIVQLCTRADGDRYVGMPEAKLAALLRSEGAGFVDLDDRPRVVTVRRGYRPRDTSSAQPWSAPYRPRPSRSIHDGPDAKAKRPWLHNRTTPNKPHLSVEESVLGWRDGKPTPPDDSAPF